MSTRFFTNAGTNTLFAKLEGLFHHNPDIERFDALVGYVLCLFNSAVVTECIKRFANNTWYEINDLRQVPIIVPTAAEQKRFSDLAKRAMEAKRCEFARQAPSQTLAAFCRATKDALVAGAPAYLKPAAQEQLLATPSACLAVIELAVNWEAEKLYGAEGLGPFDEF